MCESNPVDEMPSFEVLNHNEMADSVSSEFSIIQEQLPMREETLMNGNIGDMQSAFMCASQDLSVHEIQSRIMELAKDNAAMKEALEWNNVMMKEQLNTISAWHNQMTTSMSKQELSLNEANGRVNDLERENGELRQKLEHMKNNSKEICTQDCKSVQNVATSTEVDPQIEELMRKLNEQQLEIAALKERAQEIGSMNAAYEVLQTVNDGLKSKCNNLEDQLKEYQAKKSLNTYHWEKKILDLETEVLVKQQQTEVESIKHEETRKLLCDLQSKYDRVSSFLQIDSQAKDGKSTSQNLEQSGEEKHYLEQIDNLMAQLFHLEETLAEREEKVNMLTLQLQSVSGDSESIPVLKSQVEVYKIDLDHIKQMKEEADGEIQRLNQRIRDLGASLDPESQSDREGSSRARRNGNGKLGFTSRQGAKLFVCPLCDFGFNDAQAAQNHANKCLDDAQLH